MSQVARTCPNCGAPRMEHYCSACGQSSKTYLRATREIVGDFLSEAFDFDSRLAQTLKRLVLRPGYLSREFASNRRAAYVSPVRLYVVVSLVFFTALSLVTRLESDDNEADHVADTSVHAAAPARDDADHDMLTDPDFARIYGEMTDKQRARFKSILEKQGVSNEKIDRRLAELDAAPHDVGQSRGSAFERALSDRLLDVAEDPKGAYQTFISDLPAAMFLTLPLYAGWLKLMYRRRFYAEHLVFALHLHALLFLVGTCVLLLPDSPSKSTSGFVRAMVGIGQIGDGALKLFAFGYYLAALKAFYRESWRRTVAKFLVINLAHVTLIAIGIAVVTAFALAFY